eukprot:269294_1
MSRMEAMDDVFIVFPSIVFCAQLNVFGIQCVIRFDISSRHTNGELNAVLLRGEMVKLCVNKCCVRCDTAFAECHLKLQIHCLIHRSKSMQYVLDFVPMWTHCDCDGIGILLTSNCDVDGSIVDS